MMRVLITGAASYIGSHIAASLPQDKYVVRELDVRGGLDAEAFQDWDAVIHVAGIAHQKETAENAHLYDSVNHTLAVEAAKLAKAAGVRQFVFFSSMSVYGMTAGHITAETRPAPNTHYGKSKWAAEQELALLADDSFRVAVLRPPMIYGKGCRGNYPRLAALARKLPLFPMCANKRSMLYIETLCAFVEKLLESGEGGLFFPQNSEYVNTAALVTAVAGCRGNYPRLAALARKLPLFPMCANKRSMLYIETLCAFVEKLLESGEGGLFFPQNSEYVNTAALVTAVAGCHGKKLWLVPGFSWLLKLMSRYIGVCGKVFGSLTYDQTMSTAFAKAGQMAFEETIRRTEDV